MISLIKQVETIILSIENPIGGFFNVGDKVKIKDSNTPLDSDDFGKIESIKLNGYTDFQIAHYNMLSKYDLFIRWNDGQCIKTPIKHFLEFMEICH